jgi:hypothetical protein
LLWRSEPAVPAAVPGVSTASVGRASAGAMPMMPTAPNSTPAAIVELIAAVHHRNRFTNIP